MSVAKFNMLLCLLKERLDRCSRRKAIEPENRLALTLMYLAHGTSPQVLAWSFKMGVSTIRKIIYETCDAIWEELHGIYLAPPNQNEWKVIADAFWNKTQMPNCIGAIDGKHINIVCPRNSGSIYFNYKKSYSIVLLATCDSNYTFTFVDVGAYGSQSDGGVFARSSFGRKLLKNLLPFPEPKVLPHSTITFPHYFVGDAAFPLKRNLMRPYPGRNLPADNENFNSQLSRARILIENTFGILANRWRILGSNIHASPQNVDKIILATVVLHNFLMLDRDSGYFSHELVDREENGEIIRGQWREDNVGLQSTRAFRSNRASQEAFSLRNVMREYLKNQI